MGSSKLHEHSFDVLWTLFRQVKIYLFSFLLIFWRLVVWIWGTVIIGGIVLGALGNAAYTYLTKGSFDQIDISHLPIVIFISTHLFLMVALFLSLVVASLASFFAQKYVVSCPSASMQSAYSLQRVDHLSPGNYKLFRYISDVYIFRETDAAVRGLLRQLVANQTYTFDTCLGICIFGRPAQGKTRLAWEAVQFELAHWTLVRWPHEQAHPFDFAAQRNQQIILWLDDLHEFANPREAVLLNDLPRRFIEAGAKLIIVATCRDGDNQLQVQMHLDNLLERLVSFSLPDISTSEAHELAELLTRSGVEVYRNEFDGTPGSLVLGVRRMQGRYLHLSSPAQNILKTMKLLRSARIYTYPEAKVRAVAHDLFGLDERDWRVAYEALDREDFIKLSTFVHEERILEPIADIYIDEVINNYPAPHAVLTDDWGLLLVGSYPLSGE